MPAPWNAPAALVALADLVRTIPGQLAVMSGGLDSLPTTVTAYLTIGPSEIDSRATQVYRTALDLSVTFLYAAAGAEPAAEAALAAALNEFDRRVLRNRLASVTGNSITVTPMLNGSVESMDPPANELGFPEFALFAGQEARVYRRVVRTYQEETIG